MAVTTVTGVTGIKLLNKLIDYINKYAIFPMDEHPLILALWVLHTHLFEAAHATPYIYLTSAEMQSGKSRVIDCLELIVRVPLRTISVSDAVLYRSMERKPTIMIDEVDTVYGKGSANETLRAILNGGYRDGSTVMRMGIGAGAEVDTFATFSPKLMAGIDHGHLPGTVIDRSITIRLRRKLKNQHVDRFIRRHVEPEAARLYEEIEKYAQSNVSSLRDIYPTEITELSDRAWEISEPLIAIAELIGKKTAKQARKALPAVIKSEKEPISEGTRILTSIQDFLNGHDKIRSTQLARELHMTPARLASKLRPYEIRPTTIRFDGKPDKGYYATDFIDAFDRYL